MLHLSVGSGASKYYLKVDRNPSDRVSEINLIINPEIGGPLGRNYGRDSRGSGAEKDPTGKQVPAKGSILSTSVHHRLSSIVGVQRYILQLGNAWRVTQNTQAEPPMPQRSHHDEFFLPVEQT